MENNNQKNDEISADEKEQELKRQALEAIDLTEKVVNSKQKVSLSFVIPALSTTVYGLLSRNPYATLVGASTSLFSLWSFIDNVSQLNKLDTGKKLIKESRYEEFIEEARTSTQVQTLNNIADVLEEELFDPPDPLPESDEPDPFDDDDFFIF